MNRMLPIAVLVLLASVVTGRETPPAHDPVRVHAAPQPESLPAQDQLDEMNVVRHRRGGAVQDLFPGHAPATPVAPPAIVARAELPPVPVAPPLPFTYLGRMKKGERAIVYLRKSGRGMVIAETGGTLDNLYLVESISDTAVHFTYLPLGTKQALSLPATP